MPIISAVEREARVAGRSYSPAFLGCCSAIRHSLARTRDPPAYPLRTPHIGACHPGYQACWSERAILMPNFFLYA
jgi:hypothetical protein